MKRSTGKVIAMLMAFLFLATACSGGNAASSTPAPAAAPAASADPTEKPAEKVTLSFLNLNPESEPAILEVIDGFMKANPNITIEHEAMNSRQYDQRIQALAASEELPDIVTVQMFPQYKQMAKAGLLYDLKDTDLIMSGKFDAVAQSALMLSDGMVYGLTWNNLACGAFYNTEIFAQYNLEIPTNFDEFLAVCETLKSNGVTPIISSLGEGWTSLYPLFNAGIQEIYTKDPDYDQKLLKGEAKFNSPGWISAYTKIKTIYDKGYFGANPLGGKYDQSLSDFANGKAAMQIIGNWVIPVYREVNPNLKFSMFPIPFNAAGEQTYALFESELGMGIAANSPHKEEALKFFEYFYSDGVYQNYLMGKKGFSAIKDISVSFDESVEYISKNYAETGNTFPYMSREWPAGQDALSHKVFQEIMMGTKTIEAGMDEMDKYFTENNK